MKSSIDLTTVSGKMLWNKMGATASNCSSPSLQIQKLRDVCFKSSYLLIFFFFFLIFSMVKVKKKEEADSGGVYVILGRTSKSSSFLKSFL